MREKAYRDLLNFRRFVKGRAEVAINESTGYRGDTVPETLTSYGDLKRPFAFKPK